MDLFFSFLKIAQRKPAFGGGKIVKCDMLFVNGLNMMLRISLNQYNAFTHCILLLQVVYGADDIAYQIGETAEILSGGILRATPHCVQVIKKKKTIFLSVLCQTCSIFQCHPVESILFIYSFLFLFYFLHHWFLVLCCIMLFIDVINISQFIFFQ